MKIGRAFYYHRLGWDFIDHLIDRRYRKCNHKNSRITDHRMFSHNARNMMKKLLKQLENE